jgi:ADP-heptose:LPS heptosyltransferase
MQVERRLAPVGRYYAALFVGSRWESKLWFPEQIAECSRMIQERYGLDVVLLGSRQDEMVAAEAQARWNRRVTNVVGQTSLRESVGIIARARVSIGPDTGLMHIAAAVGTPVVSLWGATNPSRSGPYRFEHLVIQGTAPCSPCYLKHCPIGRTCMRSITTEEIAEKVALALAGDYSNDQRYGSQL